MAQSTQTRGQYIASEMQRVLANEKYMQYVYKNSQNVYDVSRYLGTALSYLVATGKSPLKTSASKNIADLIYGWSRLELVAKKVSKQLTSWDYEQSHIGKYAYIEPKKPNLTNAKLYKSILETGFVTHTFNGYNYPAVSQYGLGSDKIVDKELAKDINKLERLIHRSSFYDKQNNTPDEIYYTMPGVKSFFYGFNGVPERVFLGPLGRLPFNYPLILGETCEQYYKRAFTKFVKDKFSTSTFENPDHKNEQRQITTIEIGNRIIEKLCTHKPVIAILPINNGEQPLMARHIKLSEECADNLPEYLKRLHKEYPDLLPTEFLSKATGGDECNLTDNLQSTGVVVPPENIAFIPIPNEIEITSAIAYSLGRKPGDIIDIYNPKTDYTNYKGFKLTTEEEELIAQFKALNNERTNN